MKTIDEQIEVMQHYANGGKVEYCFLGSRNWSEVTAQDYLFDFREFKYRIKEQYPMWFKHKKYDLVVKFNGLNNCTVIKGNWDGDVTINYADTTEWEQIEEPKIITIEKLLVKDNKRAWTHETSSIDSYLTDVAAIKVKLLDSYEVEL